MIGEVTIARLDHHGTSGEATDQDMLVPDWSQIHVRLLGKSRFKPRLWPGYCKLLVGLRVHNHW